MGLSLVSELMSFVKIVVLATYSDFFGSCWGLITVFNSLKEKNHESEEKTSDQFKVEFWGKLNFSTSHCFCKELPKRVCNCFQIIFDQKQKLYNIFMYFQKHFEMDQKGNVDNSLGISFLDLNSSVSKRD